MGFNRRMANSFQDCLTLPLSPSSRYVLFSDCHRGNGKANDNFLQNEHLYLAALRYYFKKGFTYLELGDGDELWENRSIQDIVDCHRQSFELLAKYYAQNRFYALYGNHDIIKKRACPSRPEAKLCFRMRLGSHNPRQHFASYYCDRKLCCRPLWPDVTFHSAIILCDTKQKRDIYLTHGHQADLLNSTLWPLSRFLVRYLWRPLEYLGVHDPTSAAKNNTRKKKSEKRLADWAQQRGHILITGHTHHPMIGSQDSPYCNSGSCVHPAGITAIEIEQRTIRLVKWFISTNNSQMLFVAREILGNPMPVD